MIEQTLVTRRAGSLRSYAQTIVTDERWPELEIAIMQELFDRWCEELDANKRQEIYLEYLGLKLFTSKLRALAAHKLLRETDT